MSKVRRTSPNSPLGLKPAMRVDSAKPPIKVTDNSSDWAEVEGIQVPPAHESRNFQSSLGLGPVLVNGAEMPSKPLPVTAPGKEGNGVSANESFLLPEPAERPVTRQAAPSGAGVSVELDWYGATLTIPCVRAVIQPEGNSRGGQGWLLLELALDPKTNKPGWLPPLSKEEEDGRMFVPEFDCLVQGQRLHCQMLNVELFDKLGGTYFLVLRVIK